MKIVINCWVLRNKQLDGIGNFTVNTFSRMIKSHPETDFVLLCDKNFSEPYFEGDNVTIKRVFPPYRHPLLYVFFMELILPFVLKSLKPDLFISAEGFLSLLSNCKQLPLIYDLNFEHFPENLSFKNRVYYKFFFKRFARKANRIATISEYSKLDIVKLYEIEPNKIDNVYCGINSNFSVLNEDVKQEARNKFAKGNPYFFFVGSMHPRKNVTRLIQAFDMFKTQSGANLHLVVAGSILWSQSEIKDAFDHAIHKDDIHFTGRLSDEDLKLALGSAFALSFVPVFEGFGLPLVEAMESGVPVITANVTSLPEVAGDAAIYADPFDVASISDAMMRMYALDERSRNETIEKGFHRKELFSWERTASLMWECVQKCIQS